MAHLPTQQRIVLCWYKCSMTIPSLMIGILLRRMRMLRVSKIVTTAMLASALVMGGFLLYGTSHSSPLTVASAEPAKEGNPVIDPNPKPAEPKLKSKQDAIDKVNKLVQELMDEAYGEGKYKFSLIGGPAGFKFLMIEPQEPDEDLKKMIDGYKGIPEDVNPDDKGSPEPSEPPVKH